MCQASLRLVSYPPTYSYPCPSTSTIRDAVIKQISYGYNDGSNGIKTLTATAGTVDFQYLAPFNYTANSVAWATAYPYGGSYSCSPLATTSLRCDDPIQKSGGFSAPSVFSGSTIIDDRYDALYCTNRSTDCNTSSYSGHYAHPDDNAWSVQVVTQLKSWGEDSSALGQAITTFNYYRLAQTGTYQSGPWCYPDQVQSIHHC